MVHQARHIHDHLEAIAPRIVWLTALAMTAEVERRNSVGLSQGMEQPAVHPHRTDAEDETMDQDDRHACSFHGEMDTDAVGIEGTPDQATHVVGASVAESCDVNGLALRCRQ